ncbi:MAG: hypothetical protein WC372_02645 [Candidatus Neomarinimicrobiota bacterium]|jgi:hypothetical protein|nr:hypothetical protein [Candidatus Neomarinimicrobiota bacterium]MDD3966502.1 hypothetical protein [Candidatus Neomarinimicrobiota bacterium]
MKKIAVYLIVVVLLVLGGCEYFPSDTTVFPMDRFDEAACITVDKGLTTGKTLYANNDPYFLDDKNIDAWLNDADGIINIETKINAVLATGEKDSVVSTVAFATIENFYDSVSTIELYLNKTAATVDALLSGQTYSKVVITDNIEAAIAAEFDSLHSKGAQQDFTITDPMSKYDFFVEATRCLYGKNGSIPVLNVNERSFLVTCAAVEVMSLYSMLEVDKEDIYTFYFNSYMSMRVWDSTGTRIPMSDNGMPLEMAANYGGRADVNEGKVLARAEYDLKPGRYLVRWIRAESTKMEGEATTNYFRFRAGVFFSTYEADPEIEDVAAKLLDPEIEIQTKSASQCDTSLWAEGQTLIPNDLLRDASKASAIVNGLDSIVVDHINKGIFLKYDQELPEGLFLLKLDSLDADTLVIYSNGGSMMIYQRTAVMSTGGMRFAAYNPHVKGITFKEMFVSTEFDNVSYFYSFVPGLYIVSLTYDGEEDGVNLVIQGN